MHDGCSKCGGDTVLCQSCTRVICLRAKCDRDGGIVTWVKGAGNICKRCLDSTLHDVRTLEPVVE